MKFLNTLVFIAFTFSVGTVVAQQRSVTHSYATEVAAFSQEKPLLASLQRTKRRAAINFTGFYQGMFELQGIKEFPQVNCSAIREYSAEFSIRQDGNKIALRTPSGIVLEGKVRSRRRFKAKAIVTDGQLTRKIIIRGRLKLDNEAVITNAERIWVGDVKACRFAHRARMHRFFK